MNIFKIAWKSIAHRGFGSLLTILSMALGVMLVVSVLSIHGLISESFRNNSSFGYNILVGARGGAVQLTMNTVYYLSQPVENIPYEFYLAFCDEDLRREELKNSFSYEALHNELDALAMNNHCGLGATVLASGLCQQVLENSLSQDYEFRSQSNQDGLYKKYTDVAIPLCLGDSYEIENSDTFFRCVGTTPDFFNKLVLDVDTEEKFKFADGRAFQTKSEQYGYFECVLGALVAKKSGLKVGDALRPTHGDPNQSGAKIHKQGFTIVGILEGTRTPHDRAVFLNMEGFYLMEDHAKPIEADPDDSEVESDETFNVDPFAEDEDFEEDTIDAADAMQDDSAGAENSEIEIQNPSSKESLVDEEQPAIDKNSPLPIEQREVTSILVRTSKEDKYGVFAYVLPTIINEGQLEETLLWSNFRPILSQKAAQAINPVIEVTKFFQTFVGPIQWLLLALTIMICVVSAISILVGIYNSMSQRKHEIAVMRALGASRSKVMSIMLVESMMLATAGGVLGWVAGHLLNVSIGPFVEEKTGVGIGFFDIAPAQPIFAYLEWIISEFTGMSFLPEPLMALNLSPEILLIPGLIFLAILVGIYPSISAYRTDVAKSLGK